MAKQINYTVERRKREGKCSRCENLSEKGKRFCLKHLLESSKQAKDRRKKLLRDGLCTACAKEKSEENRTQCLSCNNKGKEKRKQYKGDRKCTTCGADNKDSFYVQCSRCRGTAAEKTLIRSCNRSRENICCKCKGVLDTQFKHCNKCLSQRSTSYKKASGNGVCPGCRIIVENPDRVYCESCLDIFRIKNKERSAVLKKQVMDGYGGKCSCCGEEELIFLNIDHVYENGSIERKNGIKGNVMYRKLRDENFPPGYQVLCFNCNFAKHHLGKCPHGSIKKSPDYTSSGTASYASMFDDSIIFAAGSG